MTILVIITVIFLVLLLGMLLAFLFTRVDKAVTTTRADMVAEERAFSPGVTLGHKIKVESEYEDQLKQARKLAAKKAAGEARGANNPLAGPGLSTAATAGKNVKDDPMTAVRIARFHGWDGARTGIPTGVAAAPAVAGAPVASMGAVPATAGIAPPKLIEITPNMPPEEVRKARIANSKAEAAYNKALKAAASGAPVAGPAAAVAAQAATPVAAAVTTHIEPPKLIEITPDMAPEDIRKARVANAKAESAYNKALKAAGGVPGKAPAPVQSAPATPAPQATPAALSPAPQAAVGIDAPKLIEITSDMAPEEVRKARVENAKAQSAYNKALKAAGVDPKSLVAETTPVETAPQVSTSTPMEEPEAPAPHATMAAPEIPAGIEPPTLIEINDGMAPEEIRRARVENAKASAAYNKALKAAGIDPASLKK
jgi:hypothetical protein